MADMTAVSTTGRFFRVMAVSLVVIHGAYSPVEMVFLVTV